MKTIVSYLLVFTFLVVRTTAQVPVVTYVTKVALAVESKLYVDTLVSDELMQVISEKIRIALAPRNTLTVSERYLIVSNAGHSNRHAEMLYSVFIDSNAKSAWKKLPAQLSSPSYFPFNCLLVDTSYNRVQNLPCSSALLLRRRSYNNVRLKERRSPRKFNNTGRRAATTVQRIPSSRMH